VRHGDDDFTGDLLRLLFFQIKVRGDRKDELQRSRLVCVRSSGAWRRPAGGIA
jgi:hypothetical protein